MKGMQKAIVTANQNQRCAVTVVVAELCVVVTRANAIGQGRSPNVKGIRVQEIP
jgi:hypothetical protein